MTEWKLRPSPTMRARRVGTQLAAEVSARVDAAIHAGDRVVYPSSSERDVETALYQPRAGAPFHAGTAADVLTWDDGSGVLIPTGALLVRAAVGHDKLAAAVGGVVAYRSRLVPELASIAIPGASFERIAEACAELARRSGVVYAHPDLAEAHEPRTVAAGPGTELWHLGAARIDAAWKITTGDPSVRVCILDAGVDHHHPAFTGRYAGGFDARDNDSDPAPFAWATHGTRCAGLAVGRPDTVNATSGVAPGCSLLAVRKDDVASYAKLVQAFDEAARLDAAVINCSWGKPGAWPIPQAIADVLLALATTARGGRGCLVVWAAGNEGEPVELDRWASNENVLSVAAVAASGVHAAYSDYGPAVDVAAPSGERLAGDATRLALRTVTNQTRGAVGWLSGTSAAAAVVSGLAGLVYSVDPRRSARDVRAIIEATCARVDAVNGAWGSDGRSPYYGRGLIDAQAAVSRR